MASEHRAGWLGRGVRRTELSDDHVWLGATLAAGAVVYAAYLLTHQYPAYGAGLYLAAAEEIAAHGYGIPARIPHYTDAGIPFAYPPLMMYVAGAIRDVTGLGPVTYSLTVPGLLVMAHLVPYYFTAKELLGSARLAGMAGVLYAVTPAALQWHLSAGGIVRTGALLFAMTGAYTGLRLFRSGERRWLVPSVVLFGLTVLTHPTYTVFFGLTYLLLVARFDRTPRGVAHGAIVACGGAVLAAPWWLHVASTHGFDVFLAAAGTHSGLGGGGGRVASEFLHPVGPNLEMIFYLGAYPGAIYALARRRWFLPAWLAVPGYVIGKPRFQFVAGSMLTVLLVTELPPRVAGWVGRIGGDRLNVPQYGGSTATVIVTVLVLLVGLGVGTAFASSSLDTHLGSTTQPPFVDDADRAAMTWVAHNTDGSADFVVLGDAAEWFPLLTDRTSLVGPWGVEWTTPERYRHHLELFKAISDCDTAGCLTAHLRDAGVSPDYVYVPRNHYTVRGLEYWQSDRMRESLVGHERYTIAYENQGVIVVAVRPDREGADRPSARSRRPAGSDHHPIISR